MSKIVFAGGEIDSVSIVGGSPAEVTTAGSFDSGYCRCSINTPGPSDKVRQTFLDPATNAAVDIVTGETMYDRFDLHTSNNWSSTGNLREYQDSSNQPWLALRAHGTTRTFGLF